MITRFLHLVLFSFLLSSNVAAQTQAPPKTIKLINEKHEPLIGATIQFFSELNVTFKGRTTTDENGNFHLPVIKNYEVTISYIGY